ncbi:heparinase II/III family protein [bacterium]|nr:heparinase II/III family protein [bacterium]
MRLCSDIVAGIASLAVAAGAFAAPVSPPAFEEDFANADRWQPRPGIQIEVRPAAGRPGRCLHLRGRQEDQWNYVASKPFPLNAGGKYRFTAWLHVGEGFGGYPPYFKIAFIPAAADGRPDWGKSLGQPGSTSYEPIAGGWQQLVAEVEAPAGAGWGLIALEKGRRDPIEIEAHIAEVRVREVDRFWPAPYPLENVPARLAALRDVHPRLYLTREQLAELKRKVAAEPYRALLRRMLQVADIGVRDGPPAYIERDAQSGAEQLWQRPVGNMMPHLALAYRLTGEQRYLEAAAAFIRASAGYPTWGLGETDGRDLATGHQLYGLALAHDWLYDDLDAETRGIARHCLETRARFLFEQVRADKVWWRRSYLQNHQWVNLTGLAAAGLALYGQTPEAEGWIRLPLEKFRIAMHALGPDGASHEGVPYWSYGLEYLLKFMDLARDLLGEDLYRDNAWFRRTASFRLYSMLPRTTWRKNSTLINFADGPRADWYGPDYLLRRLAAEYHDPQAQWLADELSQENLCGGEARFLNLIWFDPAVKPVAPANVAAPGLPTLRHFADLGLVFLRSGWEGNESVFAFKCGPALGHEATRRFGYDPGAGHAHPDAGTFQLFAHGDWLIVDDGYSFKRTAYQNTALVDGRGQLGEGQAWLDATRQLTLKQRPSILRAETGPAFDLVTANVAPAYDPQVGLVKFLRHIVYFRPDCWLVVDEFEANDPAEFALQFHADFPFETAANGFSVRGTNGALALTPLWPRTVAARTSRQPIENTGGKADRQLELLTLANPEKRGRVVFLTLLEAHPSAEKPGIEAAVEESADGLALTLRSPAGARRYLIDVNRARPEDVPLRLMD